MASIGLCRFGVWTGQGPWGQIAGAHVPALPHEECGLGWSVCLGFLTTPGSREESVS